jgi:vitamin B12 transporter
MLENRTARMALIPLLFTLLSTAWTEGQTPPDTFRLDPIIVTATRVPVPRMSVPAAVTVIHGDELRARGIHFVADALRGVPGASVARSGSEGGLTSLFLRGGESDYVQVMLDGVVLNDPGGAFDFGQLTTDNIERIEIVRGPVSVLYGSDAVTGVVNILTRRGTGAPRLSAAAGIGRAPRLNGETDLCPGYPLAACPEDADLGSYTTRNWDASLSGGTRALSYALGVSGMDGDGAYAFNNDYRNRTVSGRAGWSGGNGDLAVTGRSTHGRFHFPTNGAGLLVDRNQFRNSESVAVGVDGGMRLTTAVEIRGALSFHEGDYVVDDRQDGPDDTVGFFASHNANRIDRSKADAHLNVRTGSTVLTIGGEIERQRGSSAFSSESEFGPFETSSYNERSNRAAYAQIVAPVSPLVITIGGRTEDNDRFGNFTTWRAGANLRLGAASLLRASAGTGFKEPTFFENYAEGFTRGNQQLEPEESRSWEVGAEQSLLRGRARLGVTWFDQRFRNLIQYTAQPPDPEAPNYVNIGEAKSLGLELEAQALLPAGMSARASFTFTDTEVLDEGYGQDRLFQKGESLIRRPRQSFDVSLQAPIGGRIVAGAALTHVGERDDLDFTSDFEGARVELPAYSTVDAFAQIQLLARGALALHARVENLLGEDIREIANFPARGRLLELGVRSNLGF